MGRALKVVGRLEQIAKEMAAAGYMEVNPDTAHELRVFESGFFKGEPGMQASEIMRKRELESGIMTWVKFTAVEKMYVARGAWLEANRIATMRMKCEDGVTVSIGGFGAANYNVSPGTRDSTIVSGALDLSKPLEQKTHHDTVPRPPLDWKGGAKKFDPFKDFEVNARPAPQADSADSGPLGKTFQPPTANGKSSWPWGKW